MFLSIIFKCTPIDANFFMQRKMYTRCVHATQDMKNFPFPNG